MFQYQIRNDKTGGGVLTHNGAFQTAAYSGHGQGLNNVAMQAVAETGPIPVGMYKMQPARYSSRLGPLTIDLEPVGHNAFGRTAFRMHGDNQAHNQSASEGCIIAGPATRDFVNKCIATGDDMLEVVL